MYLNLFVSVLKRNFNTPALYNCQSVLFLAKLRIENLSHEIGDTIYVSEDELYSTEQLIIMVAKGDIDFAVCDLQLAKKSATQFPGVIDIDTDISFTQLQSWAVRKNSPVLLDSINSWFNQIKQSGRYENIYKRYYSDK